MLEVYVGKYSEIMKLLGEKNAQISNLTLIFHVRDGIPFISNRASTLQREGVWVVTVSVRPAHFAGARRNLKLRLLYLEIEPLQLIVSSSARACAWWNP
jgi:hypothetical protein